MAVRLFVDVEGPIRTWARAESHITALAGQRSWFGTPKGAVPSSPWITMHLVNDVPVPDGQAPLSNALVQFDCYAPLKADAAALGVAVVTAAESLLAGTLLDSTLRCEAAFVRRRQWLPDPAQNLPRYSLDVEFLVCATGA
jgi:hypothetical protein